MCPYYFAKSRLGSSDVIILPYQYILDSKLRDGLNFDLEGSILIFDEAHNLDKQCEDILGFEIFDKEFSLALDYIKSCRVQLEEQYERE